MELQNIVERILQRHGIDATEDFYLKLSAPPYMDLVMERNGDTIIVGHYRIENGDLISDPILAMEETGGYLYPVRIEQWIGDTICSYWENGSHYIVPRAIKEFRSFQRMFAKNIREQGWIESGMKDV
jgi:hypothetical protein